VKGIWSVWKQCLRNRHQHEGKQSRPPLSEITTADWKEDLNSSVD
jgi:hypothetical protein